MKTGKMNLSDYLFMQFRTMTPTLDQVGTIYYPHLSKAKLLEKARKNDFPFVCYKLDRTQKAPYFVDIIDLAFVLNKNYEDYAKDYELITKHSLSLAEN
ncbi:MULTISPECIES: pyocin activator PrtN family protein [Acinetobacter]|uniref:Pyocin activator protein PrtN n=1 Tax=Acinetobacter tianfuensis TaxID=2419603 RepID=A0A3A8E342_9GAMM|nr:pyocin activator PrtN family protein [Acinetobacter tianfuensis]RKG29357.1 hypothetical protein D7V32_15285 [Acinetobacter tianfuensis]